MAPHDHADGRSGSRSRARWAVVLFLVLMAVPLSALGCGGDSTSDEASTSTTPKTLRLASAYEFATSWDPQASVYAESAYLRNMYDGLLIENPAGSAEQYQPQLAVSWTKNDDGTEWTFKLREGVKFSDGTPFNAEAVKYSFDSTKELGQGAAYILDFIDTVHGRR